MGSGWGARAGNARVAGAGGRYPRARCRRPAVEGCCHSSLGAWASVQVEKPEQFSGKLLQVQVTCSHHQGDESITHSPPPTGLHSPPSASPATPPEANQENSSSRPARDSARCFLLYLEMYSEAWRTDDRLRSRYEITCTSISISLRLLMPFRNDSTQLILLQRLTSRECRRTAGRRARRRGTSTAPRSADSERASVCFRARRRTRCRAPPGWTAATCRRGGSRY